MALGEAMIVDLPIDKIVRDVSQPRKHFKEEQISSLAASFRSKCGNGLELGIVQPITVRPFGEDQWKIVMGESRWRAAQLAGYESIPVIVKDVSDQEAAAMALIENLQRADLSFLETSDGFLSLKERFNKSTGEVAELIGWSRSRVQNLLRVQKLSDVAKELIEDNLRSDSDFVFSSSHAEEISRLPYNHQIQAIAHAQKKRLDVKAIRNYVDESLLLLGVKSSDMDVKDPDILASEESLSERLGAYFEITKYDNDRVAFTVGITGFTLMNEEKLLPSPYEVVGFKDNNVLVVARSKPFERLLKSVEAF